MAFWMEKIVIIIGKQMYLEADRSPDKRRHMWGVYLSATVKVASEYLTLLYRQFSYYMLNFPYGFSRFASFKQ